MSVCRRNDISDVYMYEGADASYYCCDCSLGEKDPPSMGLLGAVIHLLAHQAAGDKVPYYAFTRLEEDTRGHTVP